MDLATHPLNNWGLVFWSSVQYYAIVARGLFFECDSLMIVSPFFQGSEDAFVQILYLVMQENISGELFCFDIYINFSLMDITIMI